MEIARVHCLRHVYADRTEVRVCGLDLVVNGGQRVAILGPNGSGKTTLLAHLTGLLRPLEGEVRVLGRDPHRDFDSLRSEVGVVLQRADDQILGATVWDDVAFTPRHLGLRGAELAHRVESTLELFGLIGLSHKVPHYLSGGEKRKVALAGAVAMEPRLLILDEPFQGLDPSSQSELITILNRLNAERGTAIIFTTHLLSLVSAAADTVYLLNGGRLLACGRPDELLGDAEALRAAGLQPPPLLQLVEHLRRGGLPLPFLSEPEALAAAILKL